MWHFMMSVTGDAADVDGIGIYWIPRGKDCHLDCQIEDMHTVFQANKHIVCKYRSAVFLPYLMYVYNGCFLLYKHNATQLLILTQYLLSKAAHLRRICL